MCVDDDKAILDSLREQIVDHFKNQFVIETAESGEEALEVLRELSANNCEIPVFISDCIMPDIKGDELLKQVHVITPQTATIMLTGQASHGAIVNAVNHAHLYRYVSKPWEKADLMLTISEAIKSYFKDKEISLQNKMLREMNAELQTRTQELSFTNTALTQLNQEKNEFLGIVAHDLKNPLSAILGTAEELEESCEELSKEELLRLTVSIQHASRKMFQLINNLLDVNKIETGKHCLNVQRIDTLTVLQELLPQYTQKAKWKGITIHVTHTDNQYYAMADENAITQVFDNLLSNALKYSAHHKEIQIHIQQTAQYVRYGIQDQGPGLSIADQQKLFGKFARLTPKPTDAEPSTGLGLFIVKKLIGAMNGKVWCESTLGKGTTFWIELATELNSVVS
jgi:signal transduction histidine kinase